MSGLLQNLIADRALARPEALAVLSEGAAPLTYGELDAGSNRLARMLRDLGCRRGDRVVLLMPKMPAAIVSLLGVLKADANSARRAVAGDRVGVLGGRLRILDRRGAQPPRRRQPRLRGTGHQDAG